MTTEEMDAVINERCNCDCDHCVILSQCESVQGDFKRFPEVCEEAFKLLTKVDEHNPVSHPSHYTQGGIECIEAMEAAYGKESVKVFCLLNAFKYLWRSEHKNGKEDLEKAIWYLKKRLELIDSE